MPLPLIVLWPPLAIVLQPQPFHALLALLAQGICIVLSHWACDFGARLAAVAGVGCGWRSASRRVSVGLHLFGELAEAVPFRLSIGFHCVRVVLLLRVLVRALVEELWIDFHEEFHCVVHHAVNCPNNMSALHCVAID